MDFKSIVSTNSTTLAYYRKDCPIVNRGLPTTIYVSDFSTTSSGTRTQIITGNKQTYKVIYLFMNKFITCQTMGPVDDVMSLNFFAPCAYCTYMAIGQERIFFLFKILAISTSVRRIELFLS